jgi:hypothetical protein
VLQYRNGPVTRIPAALRRTPMERPRFGEDFTWFFLRGRYAPRVLLVLIEGLSLRYAHAALGRPGESEVADFRNEAGCRIR